MSTEKIEIVRRHVEAITQLLLGNRSLQPGAMIIAGEVTGGDGPLALAQLAQGAGKDIVFLAFADTADGYILTNISIVAVRGGICHAQTECRLYLPKTGARAVVMPQRHVRGHFRLSPGELLHIDRKPADVEAGIARADARLARQVARGVKLDGRAIINTSPLAA